MMRGRVVLAVFLFIVAPIGAAVIVAVLLLFHVPPPMVFAPGRAVKSLLEAGGFHPANRIAVASTVFIYWAVIALGGVVWELKTNGV